MLNRASIFRREDQLNMLKICVAAKTACFEVTLAVNIMAVARKVALIDPKEMTGLNSLASPASSWPQRWNTI